MSASARILCYVRKADDPWLMAADRYLQRLRRSSFMPVEVIALKESRGDNLLARVRKDALLVALDERGRAMGSMVFSAYLGEHRQRNVDFVIGAADGLSQAVRERADLLLSLSSMTLPHRAALAVLCEQLYRCDSILRGTPYHRE